MWSSDEWEHEVKPLLIIGFILLLPLAIILAPFVFVYDFLFPKAKVEPQEIKIKPRSKKKFRIKKISDGK